jgi:eukaryotic-like serine/threonine-protein kinase
MASDGVGQGVNEEPLAELQASLAGRYRFERELGRGGMATVYLFHDLRHDRPVALKVLHPEQAAGLGPERFRREIRVAARLQHPHILAVHDSGELPATGERPAVLWFAMPFVDGETLRQRLARETQLPVEDAVQIAREAADALEYAHCQGVIHRDIKPGTSCSRPATRWWPISGSRTGWRTGERAHWAGRRAGARARGRAPVES